MPSSLVRLLRVLIVLEISLFVLNAVADIFLESELPETLREFLSEKYDTPWSTTKSLLLAVAASLLAALVTAWVGLWRLRLWGKRLYSVTVVLEILAVPIFAPTVTHGIADMFSVAGWVVSGMTLALIWFSPLAAQFRSQPPNSALTG